MADAASYPFQRNQSGVTLFVRLTPRSAHDRLCGIASRDGKCHLEAQVRALPEKGAANQALERLLAKQLRLPRRTIRVARGAGARHKAIHIDGDPEALGLRLRDLLGQRNGSLEGASTK